MWVCIAYWSGVAWRFCDLHHTDLMRDPCELFKCGMHPPVQFLHRSPILLDIASAYDSLPIYNSIQIRVSLEQYVIPGRQDSRHTLESL
jgi:hypothetical protein